MPPDPPSSHAYTFPTYGLTTSILLPLPPGVMGVGHLSTIMLLVGVGLNSSGDLDLHAVVVHFMGRQPLPKLAVPLQPI